MISGGITANAWLRVGYPSVEVHGVFRVFSCPFQPSVHAARSMMTCTASVEEMSPFSPSRMEYRFVMSLASVSPVATISSQFVMTSSHTCCPNLLHLREFHC